MEKYAAICILWMNYLSSVLVLFYFVGESLISFISFHAMRHWFIYKKKKFKTYSVFQLHGILTLNTYKEIFKSINEKISAVLLKWVITLSSSPCSLFMLMFFVLFLSKKNAYTPCDDTHFPTTITTTILFASFQTNKKRHYFYK